MDGSALAALGFAALFVLLFIRVPVGAALLIVGAAGIHAIRPQASLPVLAGEIFAESSNYALTILPLFILMGNLAGISGMSRDLYAAAHSWLGHFRGGLASASIVGCAGFSALSGSSLAAALTMGRVSLPEMKRFNYADSLSTGAIAAGGTLGILIPPSAGFVIYAILTEVSIGRLFIAGVVPGIVLTLMFVLTVWLVVARDPSKAPRSLQPEPLKVRFAATLKATWIIAIVVVTIGGIYAGVFSAVEAAGIGAMLAFAACVLRRGLTRDGAAEAVGSTLKATGTAFFILFGAFVFKTFVGFTGVAFALTEWVESAGLTGTHVVLAVLVAFMILGTFLEGFAMLVLTIPLIQPVLESQGIDMVWFGVLIVIVLEMALISPPVGLNVFVVKGIATDVPINTIFRGIVPFWLAMLATLALVLLFPGLTLFLPNSMFG